MWWLVRICSHKQIDVGFSWARSRPPENGPLRSIWIHRLADPFRRFSRGDGPCLPVRAEAEASGWLPCQLPLNFRNPRLHPGSELRTSYIKVFRQTWRFTLPTAAVWVRLGSKKGHTLSPGSRAGRGSNVPRIKLSYEPSLSRLEMFFRGSERDSLTKDLSPVPSWAYRFQF
ncbi:hypothetical protein NPIL_561101 [Nephila pilipes]|uniref:Uncharacterized protein n=1 Tax=Nephila pilipes TaxID=299642 RepID=A0A8X6URS7_NEPPI|nr:hypothetical protein NPIL_561101 [Nephila pilipes]